MARQTPTNRRQLVVQLHHGLIAGIPWCEQEIAEGPYVEFQHNQ